jgi:hypothetical protein
MPAPEPWQVILASLDALPSIGALAGRDLGTVGTTDASPSPITLGAAGALPSPGAGAFSPVAAASPAETAAPPDTARRGGSWWGNAALDAMSPAEQQRVWQSTLAGASQALAPLLAPSPVKPSVGQVMAAVGGGIALGREAGIERLEEQKSKRAYSDYLGQKAMTERVEADAKAAKEKREREAQKLLLGTGSALLDNPNLTPNQKILLRYALMKGDTSPGDLNKILEPEGAMKAPTTREFRQGGMVVTQEWDPAKREWKTVGQGPAFAPQQPREGEPLVEIYDPSSPTGTSMVPRSQAAGRPGAPPAGFEIAYDAQGRPVIRTGVRQGGKGGDSAPPSGYRWTDPERTRLEPIPGGPGEKASGDFDPVRPNAALGRSDDGTAVAGAQIDHVVARRHLGHVAHLVYQRLRRGDPHDILTRKRPRLDSWH